MSSCRYCYKTSISDYRFHLRSFHKIVTDGIEDLLPSDARGGVAGSRGWRPRRYDFDAKIMTSPGFKSWVSGGCVFKCKLCSREYGDSAAFWSHVKYKLNDPGYLVRKAFTDCELCRWSILHEPGKLKAHFEKYHPLVSMIEYYANYVATRLDAASSDKNRDSICTDVACDASDASDDAASVSGASNNSGGGSRADTPDLREEADQAEVLDKILEYSKFEHLFDGDDNFCCEICGATLKQVNCRDVDSHLRNCHDNLSILQYSQIFHCPSTWYEGCLFKCFLCPDFIDLSNERLRRHLASSHDGMTIGKHTELAPGGDAIYLATKIRCALCNRMVGHRRSSLYGHLKSCMASMPGAVTKQDSSTLFRNYYQSLIAYLTGKDSIVENGHPIPKRPRLAVKMVSQ